MPACDLYCSLIPVGSRQSTLGAQWFALSLIPIPPTTPVPNVDFKYFLPWQWDSVELTVLLQPRDPTGSAAIAIPVDELDPSPILRNPVVTTGDESPIVRDLKLKAEQLLTGTSLNKYKNYLSSLSLLPNSLPQNLHLTVYFRIRSNLPNGVYALAAAPKIAIDAAERHSPETAVDLFGLGTGTPWNLVPTPGHAHVYQAFIQPVYLDTTAFHILERNTAATPNTYAAEFGGTYTQASYWIRLGADGAGHPQNEDAPAWMHKLDLAASLIADSMGLLHRFGTRATYLLDPIPAEGTEARRKAELWVGMMATLAGEIATGASGESTLQCPQLQQVLLPEYTPPPDLQNRIQDWTSGAATSTESFKRFKLSMSWASFLPDAGVQFPDPQGDSDELKDRVSWLRRISTDRALEWLELGVLRQLHESAGAGTASPRIDQAAHQSASLAAFANGRYRSLSDLPNDSNWGAWRTHPLARPFWHGLKSRYFLHALQADVAGSPRMTRVSLKTIIEKLLQGRLHNPTMSLATEVGEARSLVPFTWKTSQEQTIPASGLYQFLMTDAAIGGPIRQEWDDFAAEYAGTIIDQIWPIADRSVPAPEGITFQFASACVTDLNQSHADTDLWRKIAGIGVLARELKDNAPWRLLTVAAASLGDTATDNLFQGPLLVPIPMPYVTCKDGAARRPFVTYNNAPLVSKAHLHRVIEAFGYEQRDPAPSNYTAPYRHLPVLGSESLKLLRMKYGRTYAFRAFLVDNAGGVPDKLQGASPWEWRSDSIAGLPPNPSNGDPLQEEFRAQYLRYTGVGPLRLSPVGSSNWPEFKGLSPLFSELPEGPPTTDTAPVEPHPVPASQRHLIILDCAKLADTGKANKFRFQYQPPAVEWDVFERWVEQRDTGTANHAAHLQHMKNVHREYRKRFYASKRPDSPPWSLDDPAVTQVGVLLLRWDGSHWVEAGFRSHAVARPLSSPDIARWQSAPRKITVTFEQGSAFQLDWGTDDDVLCALNIKQPWGIGLYQLLLYPMVPKAEATVPNNRFPANFLTPAKYGRTILAGKAEDYIFLEPEAVTLEAAVPIFRTGNAGKLAYERFALRRQDDPVLDPLLAASEPRTAGKVISVLDTTSTPGTDIEWRSLLEVDVLEQLWFWQGGPRGEVSLADIPWSGPDAHPDTSEKVYLWEALNMANIVDDLDYIETTVKPSKFPTGTTTLWMLQTHDFTNAPQAKYLRCAGRFHSRYEGLSPAFAPILTRQEITSDFTAVPGYRRMFIPWRGPQPAPASSQRPVIREILPSVKLLRDSASKVAPMVLFLRESFFRAFGVSEWLECRVAEAWTWDGEVHPQYGPDPSLSLVKRPGGPIGPLQLQGPFGFTWDTGARNAAFVECAFLVEPPSSAQPWDFAKLQFRRLTGVTAMDDAAAGITELWTAPLWVQFLPASVLTVLQNNQYKDPHCAMADIGTGGWKVDLYPEDSWLAESLWGERPAPSGTTTAPFANFLHLTRMISDFQGKQDNQSLGVTIQLDWTNVNGRRCLTGTWVPPNHDAEAPIATWLKEGVLQGMLIEARLRDGVTAISGSIWQALFPSECLGADSSWAEQPPEAQLTITRVIQPYIPIRS